MSSKKPVVLVIRDGWGRNPLGPDVAKEYGDATVLADTPFTDYLLANYPHSLLGASGEDVGLPDGQMGNSEVGHLNLALAAWFSRIFAGWTTPSRTAPWVKIPC